MDNGSERKIDVKSIFSLLLIIVPITGDILYPVKIITGKEVVTTDFYFFLNPIPYDLSISEFLVCQFFYLF